MVQEMGLYDLVILLDPPLCTINMQAIDTQAVTSNKLINHQLCYKIVSSCASM